MIRYLFSTTGARPWFDLAADLHDKGIATPVIWIGDPRHEEAARRKFGHHVVFSMDTLVHFPWRVSGVEYRGLQHGFFTSPEYYRAKDRVLKMMDRLDIYGTFSRLDREVYFKNVCIFGLVQIERAKPEAFLTTESPHTHAQYTLYEICKYLCIPCFKLKPWPIVPALAIESMDDERIIAPPILKTHEIHERIRREIRDYTQRIVAQSSDDSYETEYLRVQRKASSFKGQLAKYVSRKFLHLWASRLYHRLRFMLRREYSPLSPSILNIAASGFLLAAKRRYLSYNYAKYCEHFPDLKQKYVYFGLHYEPERNTNPDGHEFHDQVLALIKLRSILPDDVLIYVKEHPSQLYKFMRGPQGRSPLFYAQLKNICGVRLIGMEVHSMTLIRNALFVSTITGSLGNESAILGKRVLIFGDAWYGGSPNVMRWREGLTYEDLMAQPVHSHEQITDYWIKEFGRNYIVGCHNTSGEKRFSAYLNTEFRRLEFAELSSLFTELFRQLGMRVAA